MLFLLRPRQTQIPLPQPRRTPPPPPAPAPPADPIKQLKELAALRDSGVLTDDEFVAMKRQILSSEP